MNVYRTQLQSFDPDIGNALSGEERRQTDGVEMIASENYTYPEVLAALGSILTNKYSEGYPGRRYYGGQEYTDAIENIARDRARALFRAEHANVQPLSGSPMNQACYFAFLNPGDTVLAMDLSHGGHLTHGAPVSHMGKVFNFVRYKTAPHQGGAIDFDALTEVAKASRPKIVLCGYSSYPRLRLRLLQKGRRRSWRADDGRHLPYRRPGRGGRHGQSVRFGFRRSSRPRRIRRCADRAAD
jgi:glycine hydroxymethyltransferase